MQLASVPNPLPFNVSMVGPVIAAFGSQEQKEKFLPRYGQRRYLVVPGFFGTRSRFGSRFTQDGPLSVTARITSSTVRRRGLLSLSTPSGSSVWFAQMPVPRSGRPEFRSCSSIWQLPASRFAPFKLIDGSVEVNEVFFDNVRVPAENLVGEENKGWDYAKFLLGNERHGGHTGRVLQNPCRHGKREGAGGSRRKRHTPR